MAAAWGHADSKPAVSATSSWAGLLQRICTWPQLPLAPPPAQTAVVGCGAGLPHIAEAESRVQHAANTGMGPGPSSSSSSGGAAAAAAPGGRDLQQLLPGLGPEAAEAAYLAYVHATTWWVDATLGLLDVCSQVGLRRGGGGEGGRVGAPGLGWPWRKGGPGAGVGAGLGCGQRVGGLGVACCLQVCTYWLTGCAFEGLKSAQPHVGIVCMVRAVSSRGPQQLEGATGWAHARQLG
jgi:hypothetical protein